MIPGQTVLEIFEELISCRTKEHDETYLNSAFRLKIRPFDSRTVLELCDPLNLSEINKQKLVQCYFRSEVIAKNRRKCRLRRFKVEFLEKGLSEDHQNIKKKHKRNTGGAHRIKRNASYGNYA